MTAQNVTQCTQEKVTCAVMAFVKVHGRRPALTHLEKMLKSSATVIRRFDWRTVGRGRVPAEWLGRARQVKVLSEAEICQKKAKGGKAAVRASRKSREQAAIERVVARASQSLVTTDYVNDYRRTFNGRTIHCTKVG